MATTPERPATPAYTSYRPLIAWLNGFRDTGHIPMRVDKSHLPKASGSVQASHLAALRFLKLIDSAGKPSQVFESFILADDATRPQILNAILRGAYPFIFEDAGFDLARASSQMLEEKFRACDIRGSALLRAIAFFLAAAKDAGIKLAPGLKAPTAPPRAGKRPNGRKEVVHPVDEDDGDDERDEDDKGAGVLRFEIPIPVNRKVKISIPDDFDEADWTLLQTMFNAYVQRWKGIAAPLSKKET
ncbi:MAG: DUF5343 domain-containing protein [Rubrivivax sp.]|nr:DUF5343 domain-containing protein [Rubrivivax sp.]